MEKIWFPLKCPVRQSNECPHPSITSPMKDTHTYIHLSILYWPWYLAMLHLVLTGGTKKNQAPMVIPFLHCVLTTQRKLWPCYPVLSKIIKGSGASERAIGCVGWIHCWLGHVHWVPENKSPILHPSHIPTPPSNPKLSSIEKTKNIHRKHAKPGILAIKNLPNNKVSLKCISTIMIIHYFTLFYAYVYIYYIYICVCVLYNIYIYMQYNTVRIYW